MNLKELTWPVRIYWDLPDRPDAVLASRISEELLALKVLFLGLRCPSGDGHVPILEALQGKNLAVSLTLPGGILDPALMANLSRAGIRQLLAEFASLRAVRDWTGDGAASGCKGTSVGIVFEVNSANYDEIPALVSHCLRSGITDLVFPIQRLAGHRPPFYLTPEMQAGLAALLNGLDYGALRITIHDPFLWPVFFPGAPYHEGGCQAANSMLYISPEFKVRPCPAMPLELGDLRTDTLREIILSAARRELRRTLLQPPAECDSCGQAAACLGGCRGRALAASASLERRDPACGL